MNNPGKIHSPTVNDIQQLTLHAWNKNQHDSELIRMNPRKNNEPRLEANIIYNLNSLTSTSSPKCDGYNSSSGLIVLKGIEKRVLVLREKLLLACD